MPTLWTLDVEYRLVHSLLRVHHAEAALMAGNLCLFCGGNAAAPDHFAHCDGRQGQPEADRMLAEDRARADRLPSFTGAAAGQARRDIGMARVDAAPPDYHDELWAAWRWCCESQPEVTSDDLWRALPAHLVATIRPNIIGSLLRQSASLRHWTVDSGRVVHTTRAMGQARRLTVWRSLIYQRQASR